MPRKNRRSPVHQPIYTMGNRRIIVFLTACTNDRKPILARPDIFEVVKRVFESSEAWMVGDFILLPDHLHLFCSPGKRDVDLVRWVQAWKSQITRQWPRVHERPIWQAGFWDRQLRSDESYEMKWRYVRENPVKHGLVRSSKEWPFVGKVHELS